MYIVNMKKFPEFKHVFMNAGAISTVRDFVESTIVLRKVQQELGLSITGGSDTYLVSDRLCVLLNSAN